MIIISHRGNLDGPCSSQENTPSTIEFACSQGFEVEVDVWFHHGKYMLGHDEPKHSVSPCWLKKLPLWCHAKNTEAMEKMLEDSIHHFWHESDRFTLTSKGIPWCYPNNYNKRGIVVLTDATLPSKPVLGVCTDYPLTVRQFLLHSTQ